MALKFIKCQNQENNNLISIEDNFEDDDNFYIVMPYYNGGTLQETLGRFIAWGGNEDTYKLLYKIGKQIANGLLGMSKANAGWTFVHKDLKLDNILVWVGSNE